MNLEPIDEILNNTDTKYIKMYFVLRNYKNGVSKKSKVLEKYDFTAFQVDIDIEIREHLKDITQNEIQKLLKSKKEFEEFDVIRDSTQQLFTYNDRNKALSFYDIVDKQIGTNVEKVRSLSELETKGEIWAYCLTFNEGSNNKFYTFKKLTPTKIGIPNKENPENNKFMKFLQTNFNTTSMKLEIYKGESINLDKDIDCIYFNDVFYILKAYNFEKIVGLEFEYKYKAQDVIKIIEETNYFLGLQILKDESEANPSLHRKLVRIAKIGNHKEINSVIIQKMKDVCDKRGDKLIIKDGKIIIEEKSNIETILRLLADYYKTGEVSGKPYKTYAGKQGQDKPNNL